MALTTVSAQAQTTTENPELYFDVSTGFLASDNYEALTFPAGNTYLWQSDLVLGYNSRTLSSAVDIAVGAKVNVGSFAEFPDQAADVENPFLQFGYERENKSSILDTGFIVRERDNKFKAGDAVLTDFDSGDLVVSDGTRRDFIFNLEYATGLAGPISFAMDLQYAARRFQDVTNSNQSDRNVGFVELEAGFALNRSSDLLLLAEYYNLDELNDEKNDEVNQEVGIGVESELSNGLSFRGVVAYSRDETTQTVGDERVTTVQNEPTFDFSIAKDRKNGEVRANMSTALTSTGLIGTLTFGAATETRNGLLDFNLGASATQEGNVGPVGNIAWRRENKRSTVGLFASSQLRVDDGNFDETLNTRVRFNFDREINSISGLRLDAAAAAVSYFDDDNQDERQSSIEISYYHELTRDWELVAGYRFNQSNDQGQDPITENRIFATIDRKFTWRP